MLTSKLRRAKKTEARRSSSVSRGVAWLTAGVVLVCAFAITGFGGSYALLNSVAPVNAGTITSGTLGLTVTTSTGNGVIPFPTAPLGPGVSQVAAATIENTGNIPVIVRIAAFTATSTNGMADASRLAVVVDSTGDCAAAMGVDPSIKVSGFNTKVGSSLTTLQPGAVRALCFKLKLDSAAPASVQGGATQFTITVDGTQEAAQ